MNDDDCQRINLKLHNLAFCGQPQSFFFKTERKYGPDFPHYTIVLLQSRKFCIPTRIGYINNTRCQRKLSFNLCFPDCFSSYHITTNSVVPSPQYKSHTADSSSICSDEGLTLETSTFRIPQVQWPFYIINSVDSWVPLPH